ncbi:MAG: hypothetical protein JWQ20_1932 [Conexibacter sp.]|nr:hypothetical protein [Conexibacter sp.]
MPPVPFLPVRPRRFSASALARYANCPRAYERDQVALATPGITRSEARVIGLAVHAALERFFGLPGWQRSHDRLHQLLRLAWHEHRSLGGFASVDAEVRAGKRALALLSLFHANFDCSANPLAREVWLSCPVAGRNELYGKIDRIDRRDGRLIVVDYKTGRQDTTDENVAERLPVRVYAVTASRAFGEPVAAVELLYLSTGNTVRWRPTPDELRQVEVELAELAQSILADNEFPAVPGDGCTDCSFASECPAARAGVRMAA